MKITIISLVLVLFSVGCSKKESTTAPIRVEIAHGDIASLGEITTNKNNRDTSYNIQIHLSSAKEAELSKLVQQHPNRDVEVVFGSGIAKIRMPAEVLKPPIQLAVAYSSLDDARVAAEAMKELSQ